MNDSRWRNPAMGIDWGLGIRDWGLGVRDWGLGVRDWGLGMGGCVWGWCGASVSRARAELKLPRSIGKPCGLKSLRQVGPLR